MRALEIHNEEAFKRACLLDEAQKNLSTAWDNLIEQGSSGIEEFSGVVEAHYAYVEESVSGKIDLTEVHAEVKPETEKLQLQLKQAGVELSEEVVGRYQVARLVYERLYTVILFPSGR